MKALITEDFHPNLKSGLTDIGFVCDDKLNIDTNGVQDIISRYDLIVVNSKIKIDKAMLDLATNLKYIIRIGSGLEIVDQEECKRRDIHVISTPEGNANAVAEHCLAFILSAMNHLNRSQTDILSGNWIRERNRGTELAGKTLAIIGCGNNGSQLVKILSGIDVKILVYDIRTINLSILNKNARQVQNFEEIFENADILSLHLPLNDQTRHFVNEDFIQKFRKNIYLINTSRGQICNTIAIHNQIDKGKIVAAMLDVFEEEPLLLSERMKEHVLTHKIHLSPHIAGWTFESKIKMVETALTKLNNVLV